MGKNKGRKNGKKWNEERDIITSHLFGGTDPTRFPPLLPSGIAQSAGLFMESMPFGIFLNTAAPGGR